jgi:hypothetical protein
LIYITIPLVRTAQAWFSARFDKVWITVAVLMCVVLIAAVTIAWLRRSARRLRPLDAVILVAVTAIAGWWTWRLRAIPEEAIHLIQYGVLLVLIYRALRPAEPDLAILASALLLTTVMGTVDEIIQWIIPLRYWDFRDIGLNAGAAVLAAIAVWRLDAGPWRRPPPESIRQCLRIAIAMILLWTLCLANTPDRSAWVARRVPVLSFLENAQNDMAEYGFMHRVPGIGAFKSRMELSTLVEQDRQRGRDVAAVISRYPTQSYGRFIAEHQGFRDPLLYEARIHIFSRDFHLRQTRRDTTPEHSQRQHLTIAYREHLIVERFFPTTLAASAFVLPPSAVAEMAAGQDPAQEFVSKGGSHLITWTSETRLRIFLLSLAVFLVVLHRIIGARYGGG